MSPTPRSVHLSGSELAGSEGLPEATASAQGDSSPGGAALRYRSIAWPILLSVLTLGGVGYFTFDPGAFRQILPSLNWWLLAAAVGTVVVRVFFGGWRLHYFARGQLSMSASVRSQVAWDFFAYVTPSTVGGGPFLAVFISRDQNVPLGEATSIVLFAMLLDQLSLALTIPILVVCSMYMEVFPPSLGTVGTGALMLFFLGYTAWVLVFAYSTLIRPRLLTGIVGFLFRLRWLQRFRTRALRVMSDLQRRSMVLRTQPARFYAKGFVLTLVPWISRYLLLTFLLWSVYPGGTDALLVFLRSAALNLGSLALPTPGGAGGVEGLYVLFFGPELLPRALTAPTLLVWRVLSYYLFIIGGIFITARHLQRKHATGTISPRASDSPAPNVIDAPR